MTDTTDTDTQDTAPVGQGSTPRGLEMLRSLGSLRPESLAALEQAAGHMNVRPGETFIHEGEVSDELYVIERGTVGIYHAQKVTGQEKLINRLEAGEVLGEIALIDGGPRTLSARAETDCALTEISPARILELANGRQLLAELKGALSQNVVKRVRTQHEQLVASLRRELEAAKTQRQFGLFFLFILTFLCMGMIVTNIIAQGVVDIDVNSGEFVLQYSILLGVPVLLIIWGMKIPIAELGITKNRFRKSFLEGLYASALTVVLVVAAAYTLDMYGALPAQPREFEIVGAAFYLFHTFIQELVGRGVFQTSFQKFLGDQSGVRAVLVTAVIFATMHIHLGLAAVGVTFAGSILFGLFYLRHYNLVGVTLLHFTVGAGVFLVGLI